MSTAPSSPETAVHSFFGALFDFSFRSFVSRRLAGVFYAVGVVVLALAGLVTLISIVATGFATIASPLGGGAGAGILFILAGVVAVPIATLLAIVILRVWIEAVVALIAVAENTSSLRKE